jgi:putative transposase
VRFAWIGGHASEFPVEVMCQVLQVSRSGYYAWTQRKPGPREERRAQLVERIREAHEASDRIYGSPRVHQDLQQKGIECCENTVAKLMKEQGIRSKTVKKFRISTTDSRHPHPIAANKLNQNFQQEKIDQVWLTDITYTSRRARAGCIWPPCSTSVRGRSSAGPRPIICARSSSARR